MLRVYLSVGSIIFSTLVLQLGNGMVGPTVVLSATSQGAALTSVGLIPAAYGGGFILGCLWGRQLLHAIGHIRGFAVAAALLAALTISLQLFPETVVWIVLRGVMGCCIAVISTCADSWVGGGTPWELRGRVLAAYAVTIKLAHLGAPALLALVAFVNEQAVLYAALLFALSLVPVAMTRLPAPELAGTARLSSWSLVQSAPSAMVACLVVGLANGAVLNLLPAHSLGVGLSARQALILLSAAHVGGLVLQWPLGFLSDVADRRFAMAGALIAAALVAIVFALFSAPPLPQAVVLIFLWGGFSLSIYSICLAHAVDHVERDQLIPACATLLITWSSGAALGPALAGAAMQAFGPQSLFLWGAACHGGAGLFVVLRILNTARRRRRAVFVNVPVSGAEVSLLDPRQPEPEEAAVESPADEEDRRGFA